MQKEEVVMTEEQYLDTDPLLMLNRSMDLSSMQQSGSGVKAADNRETSSPARTATPAQAADLQQFLSPAADQRETPVVGVARSLSDATVTAAGLAVTVVPQLNNDSVLSNNRTSTSHLAGTSNSHSAFSPGQQINMPMTSTPNKNLQSMTDGGLSWHASTEGFVQDTVTDKSGAGKSSSLQQEVSRLPESLGTRIKNAAVANQSLAEQDTLQSSDDTSRSHNNTTAMLSRSLSPPELLPAMSPPGCSSTPNVGSKRASLSQHHHNDEDTDEDESHTDDGQNRSTASRDPASKGLPVKSKRGGSRGRRRSNEKDVRHATRVRKPPAKKARELLLYFYAKSNWNCSNVGISVRVIV